LTRVARLPPARARLRLQHAAWMVPNQFKPGEVARREWNLVTEGPPWAVDSWGLGIMMQEVFSNTPMAAVEQLRNTQVGFRGRATLGCAGAGQRSWEVFRQPAGRADRHGCRGGMLHDVLVQQLQRLLFAWVALQQVCGVLACWPLLWAAQRCIPPTTVGSPAVYPAHHCGQPSSVSHPPLWAAQQCIPPTTVGSPAVYPAHQVAVRCRVALPQVIPQALLGDYQKLLSSQPARRLNPAKVAESSFLNNNLVAVVAFMENIAGRDPGSSQPIISPACAAGPAAFVARPLPP
jgi:hypothetical protein